MGQNFSGALLAGVVAGMIWTAISLWQGLATETVGLWALIILIATTVISFIISTVVNRGKSVSVSA